MERSFAIATDLSPTTPEPTRVRGQAAEVSALLEGAGLLLRSGNRAAAVAALWSTVGIDPCHLGAHRRLAATLANAGDVGGAVAEYERFIEAVGAAGQPERAAAERHYGHALLGDAIPLATQASALPRLTSGPLPAVHLHQLDAEQSQALRRLAVAAVALVATFAAMLIAGSQIFAQGL